MTRAVYLFLGHSLFAWLSALIRSMYRAPRLFWEAELKIPLCATSFAAPAEFCEVIWLMISIYLAYYYDVGDARQYGGVMCTGYMIKVGLTGMLGSLLASTLFVGNFTGLTSIADSTFTLAHAMLMAIFMHLTVWPRIKLLPLYAAEASNLKQFTNIVSENDSI